MSGSELTGNDVAGILLFLVCMIAAIATGFYALKGMKR